MYKASFYTTAHWHAVSITFCDFCCFRCASAWMLPLANA